MFDGLMQVANTTTIKDRRGGLDEKQGTNNEDVKGRHMV